MVEVSKESHEVIDAINLRLSPDAAKQLAGLLTAVSVNTTTDVFDTIAEGIAEQFFYDVPEYVVDENGEFGPVPDEPSIMGCGCGTDSETFDFAEGL